MNITELLTYAVNSKCSDLHVCTGEKPTIRHNGNLTQLDHPTLTADDVTEILKEITSENQYQTFTNDLEIDFGYELPNVCRFRVNAFHQLHGPSIAIRVLSLETPSFEDLKLESPVFKSICESPNGLVLVTGATGSGKSSTLAAMINYMNTLERLKKHLITIEDPIEYLFRTKNCLIQQREVGRDTKSFGKALRSALREDPDAIMVGEMRDLETIRLALTAAETGHLVFATLHTNSAPSTINRIVDVFPGNEKEMIRGMLSQSLCAVISQVLLKTPDDSRRPACEILVSNAAVRNLIRENKVPQLYSAMQTGSALGMQTLEQDIEKLTNENKIIPIQKTGITKD